MLTVLVLPSNIWSIISILEGGVFAYYSFGHYKCFGQGNARSNGKFMTFSPNGRVSRGTTPPTGVMLVPRVRKRAADVRYRRISEYDWY
jgi:hypothetical protein